jgi:hypothetical protein
MTKIKFHNQDGTLTGYSFGCGYVELYGGKGEASATLSREPNDFHVKGFDENGKHFWEVFHLVKDARKFARKMAGKLTNGPR